MNASIAAAFMAVPFSRGRSGGWSLPIGIVLVIHLGIALVPLHFAEVESAEPPPIRLTLSMPEPVVEPTPAPVVEAIPEPVVEPEPIVEARPEPPPPVQPKPVQPKVAKKPPVDVPVVEAKTELALPDVAIAPAKEMAIEAEIPVEEDPEPVEVVEVAPRPLPPAPAVAKVDMNRYGMGIFEAVNAERRYPRMAERRRIEGTVTVRIRINKDGSLATKPAIVQSSHAQLLDSEVLRMVEAAAPFAPLPEGFEESAAELVIPIRFSLAR